MTFTPLVFLILYGYATNGLAGAAVWSLAALGLHVMLKRLTERRIAVEEQNRRLEALNRELEDRERLSAIGKMSSVISHQMLQQLGVIGIYADLIRHAEAEGDPAAALGQAKASAAAIEDALGGVNRVLEDLLVFGRDLRLNLYEHRLGDVLAECLEECRPQAAERGVALRLECPADTSARLDKLKVKQAVVNVLRNAIEASPPGADVVVRCAPARAPARRSAPSSRPRAGRRRSARARRSSRCRRRPGPRARRSGARADPRPPRGRGRGRRCAAPTTCAAAPAARATARARRAARSPARSPRRRAVRRTAPWAPRPSGSAAGRPTRARSRGDRRRSARAASRARRRARRRSRSCGGGGRARSAPRRRARQLGPPTRRRRSRPSARRAHRPP